jgi:hypothetical protein
MIQTSTETTVNNISIIVNIISGISELTGKITSAISHLSESDSQISKLLTEATSSTGEIAEAITELAQKLLGREKGEKN